MTFGHKATAPPKISFAIKFWKIGHKFRPVGHIADGLWTKQWQKNNCRRAWATTIIDSSVYHQACQLLLSWWRRDRTLHLQRCFTRLVTVFAASWSRRIMCCLLITTHRVIRWSLLVIKISWPKSMRFVFNDPEATYLVIQLNPIISFLKMKTIFSKTWQRGY